MLQVKNKYLIYNSDAGFTKIAKQDIRTALIFTYENAEYLLLRVIGGSQLQLLADADPCPLMEYCVANGYQYCIPAKGQDLKPIITALQ